MTNTIMSGLLSALTSTKTNTYNDTIYGDQIGSSRLRKYNETAKKLLNEYDANGDGYLSAKEAKEMPLFEGQDLSAKMFDKLFTSLAQRGMSQVELSRTLQLMDKNGNGKVNNKERNNFMENVVSELENGTNPNKVYAELSAEALKAGGAKSTGDELSNLKALFEKYGIDNYTPDKETTEEGATGLGQYAPLIAAGVGLLGNLGKNSDSTDSTDATAQAQALALQKQQFEQQLEQLKLQQPLQAPMLNPSSFNPTSLGSLGSPYSLGASAFPTALQTIPTVQPLSIADFNPLLAGGNSFPTAMPAQTTFAQPLAQQQPFTFAPAPVAPVQPFAYTPPAQMAPVQLSTAWMPQATVAQAQVPVAPNLVAQAQSNGGW